MHSAKKVVLPGVFTALLIGGQFILSGVSGVEIVTVLLLAFAYRYGVKQGLLVANAFTLLRCFIFGFFPNVLVLYLVYYNLFVLVIGSIGKAFHEEYSVKKHILLLCTAVGLTVLFTMLDNLITPLMYAFTWRATKVYFVASLSTMLPHIVCVGATVLVLFPPLWKILRLF